MSKNTKQAIKKYLQRLFPAAFSEIIPVKLACKALSNMLKLLPYVVFNSSTLK